MPFSPGTCTLRGAVSMQANTTEESMHVSGKNYVSHSSLPLCLFGLVLVLDDPESLVALAMSSNL